LPKTIEVAEMVLVEKMLLPRWLLPKDVDAKYFATKDATL
jgi:hypothetical protein